jgi:plasmid stabilization system protein ParE
MARYSIRHHPAAADELQEAADWYDRKNPRAGAKFVAKVKAKLLEIASTPHRWPREKDGTRQALLRPFKDQIVFRENKGMIEIVAYAHTSRRPGYWHKRLRDL